MSVVIRRRQSTFWELERDGRMGRVHFIDKVAHHVVELRAPEVSILDRHPLLLECEHDWEKVFVLGDRTQLRAGA